MNNRFFGGFLPGNASGSDQCRGLNGPGDHVSKDFTVVEREE
ncbi:hypothetical protein IC582_017277 [Cucumis melo]